MTGIWTNTGEGWKLGAPREFQDEATLHRLIQENPQLLPLAGSPRLTVLGSEVQLGAGYADILAVESTGRPTIIEVKLAHNPEARRAIVSQVIAYAAFLMGQDVESLEQSTLRSQLERAGHGSILEAVLAQDQEGSADADSFVETMQDFLNRGSFRLVLVLDEVSTELERIIAYLDSVTVPALIIDLIILRVYEVNGARIALPQRVTPDIAASISQATVGRTGPQAYRGEFTDGTGVFRASIEGATGESRATFESLLEWVEGLAGLPNLRIGTYKGAKAYTILPRINPGEAGLVTVWNDHKKPYISLWRSVFERLAPNSIVRVEQAIAPLEIRQGNTVHDITERLLDALTAAYREAVGETVEQR